MKKKTRPPGVQGPRLNFQLCRSIARIDRRQQGQAWGVRGSCLAAVLSIIYFAPQLGGQGSCHFFSAERPLPA